MNTLKTELKNSGTLYITLNRPKKLNALSEALLNDLHHTFMGAGNDNQVKTLLITGLGKAFCAGADISQLATLNGQNGYAFARQGQAIFRCLETLGKPSIAAINGYAFGGGCELAMAATMRIASKAALFCQPEVKLGVIPGYGGTQRLARLIGKGRAIELCIRARTLNAEQALNWGLVNEITEPEQLIQRSEEILDEIATMGPLAIASVLKTIDAGYDLSLEEAMELEAVHFGLSCTTKDKQEGISAFLEKRPAVFKGN